MKTTAKNGKITAKFTKQETEQITLLATKLEQNLNAKVYGNALVALAVLETVKNNIVSTISSNINKGEQ